MSLYVPDAMGLNVLTIDGLLGEVRGRCGLGWMVGPIVWCDEPGGLLVRMMWELLG